MTNEEILSTAKEVKCGEGYGSISLALVIAERCASVADATVMDGTTPGNAIRREFGLPTR